MIQILEGVTLRNKGIYHLFLPAVIAIACCLWQFDLFHSNHFASRDVKRQEYSAICTLANKTTLDPFKGS